MKNMLHNADEAKRIEALHKLKILDTNAEQDFDDIVTLAAQICNTPISIISFVDTNRQWYKAKIGLDNSETPRNISICSQTIGHDILIVPDLLKDERFANNPFVTNHPLLRFYAGIPLKTEDGFALGALCVMDKIPRVLDEGQIWALKVLARHVIKHINLRSQVLDSESKLTAYFNSTTEEVFLIDPRNNVLAFNREAERNSELMFGLQVKIGSSMLLYVEPHLHKKYAEHFNKALAGIEQKHESLVKHNVGSIWWQVSYLPMKNEKEQVIGVAFTNKNITAQKKAEEERRKSIEQKQYLAQLSETVGRAEKLEQVYTHALDAMQHILFADKAAILLFDEEGIMRFKANKNLSSEYIKVAEGNSPWITNETKPAPIFIENIAEEPSIKASLITMQKEGIEALGFIPLLYKNMLLGKLMIYYNKPHIFSDEEKKLCYLIASQVAYAINQKKTDKALQKSEDNLRTVFDNTEVGYVLVNKNLEILSYNYPAYLFTENEFKKKLKPGISIVNYYPGEVTEILNNLYKTIEVGSSMEFDKEVISAAGIEEWYNIKYSPVRNKEKEIVGLVLAFKNITKRKRSEIELSKSFNLVSQQNKRLLNFSYIVSHNLRSHATNIKSILPFLYEAHSREEVEEMLTHLSTVSDSLDKTLINLNEIVSINNNVNLIFEPLILYDYVQKTIQLLHTQAEQKKAIVTNNISQKVIVKYNPAFLESIIFNFISNAIKYSSPLRIPHIYIDCFYENNKPVFQITDNGIGINLERHGDKLFGMYKTFHGNKDARGIGLFICKNQVEFMGGRIEVESEVDKGSIFKIYF